MRRRCYTPRSSPPTWHSPHSVALASTYITFPPFFNACLTSLEYNRLFQNVEEDVGFDAHFVELEHRILQAVLTLAVGSNFFPDTPGGGKASEL